MSAAVVIPVYNAPEALAACLESLVAHTDPGVPVVLVDDCSPDTRIEPLLRHWLARDERFRSLRTPGNQGFPGAANAGQALLPADCDVVWLNSDTRVSPGWLEELQAAVDGVPGAGIACPLSNNATILSVPRYNDGGALPADWPFEQFAADIRAEAEGLAPFPIPTAVGFCMYVRRAVIDRLGGFDPVFAPGYGEECDYSLRAWRAGFGIVCAPRAVVFHASESSFGKLAGVSLVRRVNEGILDRRWPGYRAGVRQHCLESPLRPLLERLWRRRRLAGRDRPQVLHLVHRGGMAGGVENHAADLASGCAEAILPTILEPAADSGVWADLRDLDGGGVRRIAMPLAEGGEEAERRLGRFLQAMRPQVVHIHHWLGWGSLNLARVAREQGCSVVVTLHDYFLLCPNYNLVLPDGNVCGKPGFADSDDQCRRCLGHFLGQGVDSFRGYDPRQPVAQRLTTALDDADALIFPSQCVARRFRRVAGDRYDSRTRVLPHLLVPRPAAPAVAAPSPRGAATGPLRVTFLGAFNWHKGADVFLEASRRLKGPDFAFNIVGRVPPDRQAQAGAEGLPWSGPYGRDELPTLLAASDVVCILSRWDETYCLTFDEALASGCIVVHTTVGAVPERAVADDTVIGIPANAVEPLVAALLGIRQRRLRSRIPVARPPLTLPAGMMGPYGDLYAELARRSRPPPAALPATATWLGPLLADGLAELPERQPDPAAAATRLPRIDVLLDARGLPDPARAIGFSLDRLRACRVVASPVLVLTDPGRRHEFPDAGTLLIPVPADVNRRLAQLAHHWLLHLPAGYGPSPDWPAALAHALETSPEAALIFWDDALLTGRSEPYRPLHRPEFDRRLYAARPDLLQAGFLVDRPALMAAGGFLPGAELLSPALVADWQRQDPARIRHLPLVASHQLDDIYWGRVKRRLPAQVAAPAIAGQRSGAETAVALSVFMACQDGHQASRLVNQLLTQAGVAWQGIHPCWIGPALPAGIQEANHPRVRPWRQAADLTEFLAAAAAGASGEWLLLVTDALFLERVDSVYRLLAAVDDAAAVVAPRLLDARGQIFAAGWLLGGGDDGVVAPYGGSPQQAAMDDAGYLTARRRVGAVSPVCALVRRSALAAWQPAAGCRHFYAFTDLCLQLAAAGWHSVCAADTDLRILAHGYGAHGLPIPEPRLRRTEADQMLRRWGEQLAADPCHNRNLGLRSNPWAPDPRLPIGAWPAAGPRPRVVAMPYDSWACGHYRVRDPLRHLARAGMLDPVLLPNHEVGYMPSVTEMRRHGATVLLAHNPFHDYQIRALEAYRRHLGLRIVVGMDDLLTGIPSYNSYSQTIYRDIAERIAAALASCDLLVASTEAIARAYGPLAPASVVIANAIDPDRWPLDRRQEDRPRPAGRRLRIGWAGAVNHGADLEFLNEVIRATTGAADWFFMGMAPPGTAAGAVQLAEMVPFAAYPGALDRLQLDLALAPLADNPFNRAKSNLKLLEYGALGLAAIASDLDPYRGAPVVLLDNDPGAWTARILADAGEPERLRERGRILQAWVAGHFRLEQTAPAWLAALTGSEH